MSCQGTTLLSSTNQVFARSLQNTFFPHKKRGRGLYRPRPSLDGPQPWSRRLIQPCLTGTCPFSGLNLGALSASWAIVNHTPLEDIMQATFSSFYLRSFQNQQGNLSLLGPLVVAQRVVSASASSTNPQSSRHH